MSPDLSTFDNSWYHAGRSTMTRMLWFFLGLPVLRSKVLPSSRVRIILLRIFGARIGDATVIKPGVRVKYPWLLSIGNRSWIGEDVWIDNLANVEVGDDVCISQGAYLCTGNHDWSDPAFGLVLKGIKLMDGSWVGAKTVVTPGVELGKCAIAAAGSVVTKSIPSFEIHSGNPTSFVRRREIMPAKINLSV